MSCLWLAVRFQASLHRLCACVVCACVVCAWCQVTGGLGTPDLPYFQNRSGYSSSSCLKWESDLGVCMSVGPAHKAKLLSHTSFLVSCFSIGHFFQK